MFLYDCLIKNIVLFSRTDALIQTTIKKKFRMCTVLTIAHRLNTIMDSDRVLVMNAGTLVEFDHPHLLLNNKNGLLHKMVEQTGHSNCKLLHRIALDVIKILLQCTIFQKNVQYLSLFTDLQ